MNERIVFMGTASFSLEVLKMLLEENYNIVGVVTQPDRYVGRKKILTMSEVKQLAIAHDIPVIQPSRIKNDFDEVLALKPDLIITAAYGQIVPKEILEAPQLGCINVHASLLPKLRGGAPVHYAIINGEDKTGVTIMYMTEKMDAGDIISQEIVSIEEDDNTGILYDRLSHVGARLLSRTLPSILKGTNNRYAQDERYVTYAPIIKREDERLDWNQPVKAIYNRVRGTVPWPVSYTVYHGTIVKIWGGKIHHCQNAIIHHGHEVNGTIIKLFKDAIGVKVMDGVYLITELQIAGKKRMTVKDYMNGQCMFETGEVFGELL